MSKPIMNQSHFIQYHNADAVGAFPTTDTDIKIEVDTLLLDNSATFAPWIYTRKKIVKKAIGSSCFLIVGKTEKIKKYYLWSYFQIEQVHLNDDGVYIASGPGYNLRKPMLLNNVENFTDFRNFCGNFGIGFQSIDNHIFCDTLLSYLQKTDFTNIANRVEIDLKLAIQLLDAKMQTVEPTRLTSEVALTIRKDRRMVELLKLAANYKCQFPNCESSILTKSGANYVEVAHIHPVHKGGKSVIGNLIVLCPNHHKEFDYGNLNISEQSPSIIRGILNNKPFAIETLA